MIVTQPNVMLDGKFQAYYEKNVNRKINVLSSVYVEECLTSRSIPEKSDFQVIYNHCFLRNRIFLMKISTGSRKYNVGDHTFLCLP